MLTPKTSALLQSFLRALPQSAAARLVKAVEVDRLQGGKILPHDTILGALRPALSVRTERTPTPLRLFCTPFEDLLVQAQPREKQRGRIARASIPLVWRWLRETLIIDGADLYASEIKRLVLAGRFDESAARASEFWTFASQEMRKAIDTNRAMVRVALQSDVAVADAEEMALLLSAGADVVAIQKLLPKPVPQLNDELLHALREIHDHVAATQPDVAPYVAVIAMNRLEHPWEALKLPQLVTNQTQDTLISLTDMGLVGDVLLARIEFHGNAVRATRHPVFDADEVVEHLAHFTELSSRIVKEIEMRRDGKWGKRLLADRAAVAETMDGLMERAPKEVLAMLPIHKSGSYGGGPLCADLSKPVDAEKSERGMRYGKLLVGSSRYATAGSFAASHKTALDDVNQHLLGYNEDLIKEMRVPEGERQPGTEHQFELAAELTALIFTAEEAEHLRRRARAATAPAVAA
ncbi:MAG TPA: hypothetical protein VMF58_10405 [Rhizomicrobium sp.]|nr:hypothetical protein [Rhizomicrobium sp.]